MLTIAIVLFILACFLTGIYVHDVRQSQHTILRNYPVIGHFRYFAETWGEYMRQYQYLPDWVERPFNRLERSWIYRSAKNVSNYISFGSEATPSFAFKNAAFPVLEEDRRGFPGLQIGITEGPGACAKPFMAKSFFNISGMSYGALSHAAVTALSKGAKQAGVWMGTGEGGLSPYHLQGGADIIFQIGTAKYGVRDAQGNLDEARLRSIGGLEQVRMIEVKLAQGAKPGKGGVLPGAKVTAEIARIRGIPEGADSISPNRHYDIADAGQLLDSIARVRELTGRPVGVKTAIGGWDFMKELCEAILRRGLQDAPDFLVIDGGEGGSGAAPQTLMDHMSLPIAEALPRVVDALVEAGLRERIRVVASGKLVTSARAAWALCAGADFVNTARGPMFALGCIQAMRCHTNTCPTGVTTHNKRLQRGLVVEEKSERIANYIRNMNKEIDMIAHSCGCRHARALRREHVRIVETAGRSVAMNQLYPGRRVDGAREH